MNSNYVNYLKATKKSEGTIARYCEYINRALSVIGKEDAEITYMDLIGYQASISNLSADTIRVRIAAIKSYFQFLVKSGVISSNPASSLDKPKSNPKEKPYMVVSDVRAMIDATKSTRDKAIILTFASTGLRVSELTSIKLNDYLEAMNNGTREIKIMGKGAKERTIYINEDVQKYIDAYLKNRKVESEYLFASYGGGQIARNNLGLSIKNSAKKAGLPYWERVSNHTLRTAFATVANDNGISVATISKALGHANLQVTSRYIKNSQKNINKAMASMSF